MFRNFIQKFKIKIAWKDVMIWFVLSFICVLFIYLFVAKRILNVDLFIEVFGFSVVFVILMIMTKSYGQFAEGFYQSFIDKHKH